MFNSKAKAILTMGRNSITKYLRSEETKIRLTLYMGQLKRLGQLERLSKNPVRILTVLLTSHCGLGTYLRQLGIVSN